MKELLRKPLTSNIRELREVNRAGDQGQWIYYGSSLWEVEQTFKPVLGDLNIESYVLSRKEPVFLEFMSPLNTVRKLFGKMNSENKLGIAVSLSDHRSDEVKKADEEKGLHQIAGDIMNSSTWDKIKAKLNNRKADLILERGGYGLHSIPRDQKFSAIMVNKMWDLLSPDNGMLLLQVRLNDVKQSWIDYLNAQNINAHYVKFERSMLYPLLRIDKNPNSPEKLPFFQ